MARTRKRIKVFFIILNILVVVIYLLACLTPFLDAGRFWFAALCGLIFPVLFMLILLFLIGWLIARSRWVYLCIAAILLSTQQLLVLFGLSFQTEFKTEKSPGTIRVLSWNVSRWDERNKQKRGGTSYRPRMLELIQKQNADILCFQEFFECHNPKFFEANIPVLKAMGYPYHYFFPSANLFDSSFQYGLMILSKHPIIDSAKFPTGIQTHSEGACFADIRFDFGTIRVFTANLESPGFSREEYQDVGNLDYSKSIIGKIKNSYQLRNKQVEFLKKQVESSPHPVILCLDLDDVPNSNAYFTLKHKLEDAFLKKGKGIGRTLRIISPTLRIDYIFVDRKLKVKQFTRVKSIYSAHYPLIADLQLK